jgi:hypothetical protein
VEHVFDPQTRERARDRPRLLIHDGFGAHESLEVMRFSFTNRIVLCRLPSHKSHKLQPYDVSAFGPLQTAYRAQVENSYRLGRHCLAFLIDQAMIWNNLGGFKWCLVLLQSTMLMPVC